MFCLLLAMLLQIQPIPDAATNGDVVGGPLDTLREWFDQRAATEDLRYHGMRSLLQELRDRPQVDNSPLFPRINAAIEASQAARAETVAATGPIREAIEMLTRLVYALILLAGVLLIVDIYRTFFRKAA